MEQKNIPFSDFTSKGYDARYLASDDIKNTIKECFDVEVDFAAGLILLFGEPKALKQVDRLIRRFIPAINADPIGNPTKLLIDLIEKPSNPNLVNYSSIKVRGRTVTARNENQSLYIDLMREYPLVFGIGPAGTGKTFLPVCYAVSQLELGAVDKIIITRPPVDAGEKIGFIPGTIEEKMSPYLAAVIDELVDLLGKESFDAMVLNGTIEIGDLSKYRGRTLKKAFIIFDEMQNATESIMRLGLTRLGEGSQMVITGDPTQCDLPSINGLEYMLEIYEEYEVPDGIAFLSFNDDDIVRHPIVAGLCKLFTAKREADMAEKERVKKARSEK